MKLNQLKNTLACLITLLFLFGCKSKEENNQEMIKKNIISYFKGVVLESKEDFILDSVSVLEIDTITPKKDSILKQKQYFDQYDELLPKLKEELEKAKLNTRIAELNKELGRSFKYESDEAQQNLDNSKRLSEKSSMLLKAAEDLQIEISKNKIDSVTITGYLAKVNVYAHSSNQVNKDLKNIAILLDKNLRINEKLMEETGIMEK